MRPHIHLGALIMATMLVLAVVGALFRPWLIRHQTRPATTEDRSDRKHWNNDASLQGYAH